MKGFIALLVAILLAGTAQAAQKTGLLTVAAGVNGAWLSESAVTTFPAVELGGTASSSLSPHISLVGSSFYGLNEQYVRYTAGGRVTATDVNNPNFNVFLGVVWRGGDQKAVQPNEWAPEAGFGWKPNTSWPLVVGADAGYGLDSHNVLSYVALRYVLPLK